MEHIQAYSGIESRRSITTHRVTSHEREHRTDALATQCHMIGDGLVELTGCVRIRNCSNRLIDYVKVFLK